MQLFPVNEAKEAEWTALLADDKKINKWIKNK